MQFVVVTRENWARLLESAGIRLEVVAAKTGRSYSTVYAYKAGRRVVPDAFIADIATILQDSRPEAEATA